MTDTIDPHAPNLIGHFASCIYAQQKQNFFDNEAKPSWAWLLECLAVGRKIVAFLKIVRLTHFVEPISITA